MPPLTRCSYLQNISSNNKWLLWKVSMKARSLEKSSSILKSVDLDLNLNARMFLRRGRICLSNASEKILIPLGWAAETVFSLYKSDHLKTWKWEIFQLLFHLYQVSCSPDVVFKPSPFTSSHVLTSQGWLIWGEIGFVFSCSEIMISHYLQCDQERDQQPHLPLCRGQGAPHAVNASWESTLFRAIEVSSCGNKLWVNQKSAKTDLENSEGLWEVDLLEVLMDTSADSIPLDIVNHSLAVTL